MGGGPGFVQKPMLTIFGLKTLLRGIGVTLSPSGMSDLKKIFDSFSNQGAGYERSIDFCEFLRLMRHLLDFNFAGIQEHSAQTVKKREVEKAAMEGLLLAVERQKMEDKLAFEDG